MLISSLLLKIAEVLGLPQHYIKVYPLHVHTTNPKPRGIPPSASSDTFGQ